MSILRFLSLLITGFFAIAGLMALLNIPKTISYYDDLQAGNLRVDSIFSSGSVNHKKTYLRGLILLPNEASPISRSQKYRLPYDESTEAYLKSRRIERISLQEKKKGRMGEFDIKIHYLSAAPARKEQVLIPCWFKLGAGGVILRLDEEKPARKEAVKRKTRTGVLLLTPFLLTGLFWFFHHRRRR